MKYVTNKALLWLTLLSPLGSFAQVDSEGLATATITDEYCVSLDTESSIKELYVIDISHLHLVNEIEAKKKFGYINNNLLTYEVNFSEEEVYLHVHLDRTPEPKDITWWNDYINSLCGL